MNLINGELVNLGLSVGGPVLVFKKFKQRMHIGCQRRKSKSLVSTITYYGKVFVAR